MAVATAASRATGLVRTLALAWALGVSSLGDAYNVANTAPNMLFQLAAGGVLSSAVVPLLSQLRSDEERSDAARALFGAVLAVGVAAAAALALAAPWVIRLLTAGAAGRADRTHVIEVGTVWLRIFAPQVVFYAVSVFSVGVLTSRRRLFLGASAPVITNLITIAGIVAFVVIGGRRPSVASVSSAAVLWLGVATTAGVAAMAAIQLVGAWRLERSLRPRFDLRHEAIKRAGRIAPWVGLYVLVNQVGLAAVVAFASSVAGGVSAYQWSFAVMQLPHALIGVSIVTAAFPRISETVTDGPSATSAVVNDTLRKLLRLMVPSAAVMAVLAPVLAYGIVGSSGRTLVAAGIVGFAVSLVPFSVFQLLTRTSYAFKDARGPAVVNVAVNVANIAADAVILVFVNSDAFRVGGLALGHAISYTVGVVLLIRTLRERHGLTISSGRTRGERTRTGDEAARSIPSPPPSRPTLPTTTPPPEATPGAPGRGVRPPGR